MSASTTASSTKKAPGCNTTANSSVRAAKPPASPSSRSPTSPKKSLLPSTKNAPPPRPHPPPLLSEHVLQTFGKRRPTPAAFPPPRYRCGGAVQSGAEPGMGFENGEAFGHLRWRGVGGDTALGSTPCSESHP